MSKIVRKALPSLFLLAILSLNFIQIAWIVLQVERKQASFASNFEISDPFHSYSIKDKLLPREEHLTILLLHFPFRIKPSRWYALKNRFQMNGLSSPMIRTPSDEKICFCQRLLKFFPCSLENWNMIRGFLMLFSFCVYNFLIRKLYFLNVI